MTDFLTKDMGNAHLATYKQKNYGTNIHSDLNLDIPLGDVFKSMESAANFIGFYRSYHDVYQKLTSIVRETFKEELRDATLISYGKFFASHPELSILDIMARCRIDKATYLDGIAAYKGYMSELALRNDMSADVLFDYQVDIASWERINIVSIFYELAVLSHYNIKDAVKLYVWQYALYVNEISDFNDYNIFLSNLLMSENLDALYGKS